MKVFISHSSRDKWIARKLSEEINSLGCKTFLDEKDIETGESIDETIHSHLFESDDFLLLLSPDSVKSQWVLIELGGALALKKRVVVILLYLGANDIPQPINNYLARDINEIDKYYDELKKKLSGKPVADDKGITKSAKAAKEKKEKKPTFEPGGVVTIISVPQSYTKLSIGWAEDMDKYCGKTVKIVTIDKEQGGAYIDADGGRWVWAFEWLTHVN